MEAAERAEKWCFFVPDDFDLWSLTLTFKLVRARNQTRLPCEFGANPFSSSRNISQAYKKVRDSAKNNLPQFTACDKYESVLKFLIYHFTVMYHSINQSKDLDSAINWKQIRRASWRWLCTYIHVLTINVWFNHIHLLVPMCIPSNTCFLGPTRLHSPNGILIGSAVFSTAHDRQSLYFTMYHPFPPQNCPFT